MVEPSAASKILELMPHQAPFRFIDRILELEEKTILSRYRFREEEYYYKGHFPGNPITPGVILIEAMAQTGLVALGIALMLRKKMPTAEIKQMTLLFALADRVQFDGIVYPNESVLIKGENLFFRKNTIRSEVRVSHENGARVCSGTLTGTAIGVKNEWGRCYPSTDKHDHRSES